LKSCRLVAPGFDFALLRSALFHLAQTDNPVFIWPQPTTKVAERQSNATAAKSVSIP
jgi:hypothetical protein